VQTNAYRDFASTLPGLEGRRLRSFKQAAFLFENSASEAQLARKNLRPGLAG
jgi:hypothetical protein